MQQFKANCGKATQDRYFLVGTAIFLNYFPCLSFILTHQEIQCRPYAGLLLTAFEVDLLSRSCVVFSLFSSAVAQFESYFFQVSW